MAHDLPTDVSNEAKTIKENMLLCKEAVVLEKELSLLLFKASSGYKEASLIQCEDQLLSVASIPQATKGTFMCCLLSAKIGHRIYYLAHLFESGCFTRFSEIAIAKLKADYGIDEILIWHAYNSDDIEIETTRRRDKLQDKENRATGKDNRLANNQYMRSMKKLKNECTVDGIMKHFSGSDLTMNFYMVYVARKKQKFMEKDEYGNDQGYVYVNSDADHKEAWKNSLLTFQTNPPPPSLHPLRLINPQVELDLEHQFEYISLLPNSHKFKWPGMTVKTCYGKLFSHADGVPTSPRNRILHAVSQGLWDRFLQIASNILKKPVQLERLKKRKPATESDLENTTTSKTLSKKSKTPLRSTSTDTSIMPSDTLPSNDDHPSDLPGPSHSLPSVADLSCNLGEYQLQSNLQYFFGELYARGTFVWRVNNSFQRTVMMNDIDCNTGNMKSADFIHTSATITLTSTSYHCECRLFDAVADGQSGFCVHTRLLEFALRIQEDEFPDVPNWINCELLRCPETVVEVFKVPVTREGTEKYSVVAEETAEFVSEFMVSKTSRKMVRCHSGLCNLHQGRRRLLETMLTAEVLCCHLLRFRDYWVHENSVEVVSQPADIGEEYPADLDTHESGVLQEEKWREVFDEISGQWTFHHSTPSSGVVVPLRDDTADLVNVFMKRRHIRYDDPQTWPVLEPGSDGMAVCGGSWSSAVLPDRQTTVYLPDFAVNCQIMSRLCSNGCCRRLYDGQEDALFFLSKGICISWEVGYEFIDSVNSSKETFSGFRTKLIKRYRRNGCEKDFVSAPTFINWWFAWASAMRLEFRQQCKLCQGPSKVLACDGTRLGITYKNTFVTPIETPTDCLEPTDRLKSSNRRNGRCFMSAPSDKDMKKYSDARKELKDLSKTLFKEEGLNTCTAEIVERIMVCLPSLAQPSFERMVAGESTPLLEREALAAVFELLSEDCSVDTMLPLQLCYSLKCGTRDELLGVISELEKSCPELAKLLASSSTYSGTGLPHPSVASLLIAITQSVLTSHSNDIPPQRAEPVVGSYNPAKNGIAYYFEGHGMKLREVRDFHINHDKDRVKRRDGVEIYDDLPDDVCAKDFPRAHIGKKGTSYVFLWFCPRHEHCLGYHIIPGSEGRKDPFASLYCYADLAPWIVLYDFACSLSEYLHNRESGHFKDTRFFHDIFHGYTHKCSKAFKIGRIPVLKNGLNTSVCEQFNSFIKRIARSGCLMSQVHFSFFMQFFIHQWNKDALVRHEKRRHVGSWAAE